MMARGWQELLKEKMFIDGAWCDADSGEAISVDNPATGGHLGTVPKGGAVETKTAIEAAHVAFASFSRTTAAARAALLRDLSTAFLDNQEPLAQLLTREQGKPLPEARAEVAGSAAYLLWFAEEARRAYGDVIPSPWSDRRLMVTKSPVGVVGAITPWNFPSSMLARKIGPALAAGCTVVAKPASQTPFSALAWGILAQEVGIPRGVINIVTGTARDIGTELTSNPFVRKITFTGSTDVGKVLIRQAAESVKRVSMELGGNAPFIVFNDADLEKAVAGAVAAKFRNAGQTCVCSNRLYVQSGIYDRFITAFKAATHNLVVGPGLMAGVTQGPLIDVAAVMKIEKFIDDAIAKGGRVVSGGRRHPLGPRFFEPTIIADASSSMNFARDEIFGPVAPVFRFDTEDQAVAAANATEFGLAAYFYTRDLGRAFRVSEGLQYGLVGINEGLITTEVAPFGGLKESGVGREGSKYGLDDYLDTKYVCVGGLGL